MAQAFPAGVAQVAPQPAAEQGETTEKNPTDPKVKLPAAIPNEKTLDKGHMKWTLKAENHSKARVDVEFKPDATKVEAKNVSFGQTVINKVGDTRAYAGGSAPHPPLKKSTFEPFEEPGSKKRIDHFPDAENDPFYGAEWDQSAKKWKQERAEWKVGSSTKGKESSVASMFDTPGIAFAREGLGDTSIEFETVPMILETRQPLGSLKWGFKTKDSPQSPIELTGATKDDCVDTPSDEWGATMDHFYAAKFEEILDDFDIAKAELKADHTTKLDNIVTKMKAKAELKAQLGGAADLTGNAKFNMALSLKRAQAARDYLVAKGIDAGRLEVQSYGADWARVEAEPGASEGKNRRVQIWLH
jgi:outer membrane protein OmpA-like peptidoglycan-associated protein